MVVELLSRRVSDSELEVSGSLAPSPLFVELRNFVVLTFVLLSTPTVGSESGTERAAEDEDVFR